MQALASRLLTLDLSDLDLDPTEAIQLGLGFGEGLTETSHQQRLDYLSDIYSSIPLTEG